MQRFSTPKMMIFATKKAQSSGQKPPNSTLDRPYALGSCCLYSVFCRKPLLNIILRPILLILSLMELMEKE